MEMVAAADAHVQRGVQRKSVRDRRAKVDGQSKVLTGLVDTVHELLRVFGRKFKAENTFTWNNLKPIKCKPWCYNSLNLTMYLYILLYYIPPTILCFNKLHQALYLWYPMFPTCVVINSRFVVKEVTVELKCYYNRSIFNKFRSH